MSTLRFLIALPLCAAALCLPYRARAAYFRMVAAVAHFPFRAFGMVARVILAATAVPSSPRKFR
jgi:hypothetical protein